MLFTGWLLSLAFLENKGQEIFWQYHTYIRKKKTQLKAKKFQPDTKLAGPCLLAIFFWGGGRGKIRLKLPLSFVRERKKVFHCLVGTFTR